jgi:hypothetical protein
MFRNLQPMHPRRSEHEMTLIHVPSPSQSAMNPDRPVSSLLKIQMEHLQQAEKRLPPRYQTEIYINAIKTEGEAANYIRAVTEAIHTAHEEAAAQRLRPVRRRKRVLEIAAVADDRDTSNAGNRSKVKTRGRRRRNK